MHSPSPDRIEAPTVLDWLRDPDAVTVIDVRSPAEYETAHIAASYNVPLNLLGELAARLDRKVVLVCQSGTRAAEAQQRLAGVGAANLHVLAGGEVIRGRARWSLERQVRLVAGSLVVTGIGVGRRVPKAALLAGGVAAGLTLSALTNTCTMGRILAALPHNRGPHERTAAEVIGQLPRPPAGSVTGDGQRLSGRMRAD